MGRRVKCEDAQGVKVINHREYKQILLNTRMLKPGGELSEILHEKQAHKKNPFVLQNENEEVKK